MKFFKRRTEAERMLQDRAKIINRYTEQTREAKLLIDHSMSYLNSVPTRSAAGLATSAGSFGAMLTAYAAIAVEYSSTAERLHRAGQDSSPAVVRALLDHGHQIINPHNMQLALPLLTATGVATLAYAGLVKLKQGFVERKIAKAKQVIAEAEEELHHLASIKPTLGGAQAPTIPDLFAGLQGVTRTGRPVPMREAVMIGSADAIVENLPEPVLALRGQSVVSNIPEIAEVSP